LLINVVVVRLILMFKYHINKISETESHNYGN